MILFKEKFDWLSRHGYQIWLAYQIKFDQRQVAYQHESSEDDMVISDKKWLVSNVLTDWVYVYYVHVQAACCMYTIHMSPKTAWTNLS